MAGLALALVELGSVLVIAVLAIIFFRWQAAGDRQLEEEMALLRQSGEPVTSDDLEAYYSLPTGVTDTTRLWSDAAASFNTEAFKTEVKSIPVVGLVESAVPPPGEPWEKLEEVQDLLSRHAASMRQLHEAARADGVARYKTRFQDGLQMSMNEIELRDAARMLKLEAQVKAHQRDSVGAINSIRAILRLARSLEAYPQLVAQLQRMAIANIAYDVLADLLPYLDVTDDELAALANELSRDDYDQGLYRSLVGDRVIGLHVFDHPESALEDPQAADKWMEWQVKWMKQDRAFYLSQMRRAIAATKEPWHSKLATAKQLDDEISTFRKRNKLIQLQHLMSLMLSMPHIAVFNATGHANAMRDGTVVAVAVERFRRQNDALPETLRPLVPNLLDSIPMDPFDGQALRYRVDSDKYIIYSVGKNLQDDLGQAEKSPKGAHDYVVAVPRVPQPITR